MNVIRKATKRRDSALGVILACALAEALIVLNLGGCPQQGACCAGDGCKMETSESCLASGGVFQGTGTLCGRAVCDHTSPLVPGLYAGQATGGARVTVAGVTESTSLALPYQLRISETGLPLMRRTSGSEFRTGATDTVAFGPISVVIEVTDVRFTTDSLIVSYTARATVAGTTISGSGTETYRQQSVSSLSHTASMTLAASGQQLTMIIEQSGSLSTTSPPPPPPPPPPFDKTCPVDFEASGNQALIEHGPGACENTGTEPGPSVEFYDVTMPSTVQPGAQVNFRIDWNRCSDCNPNAVIYSSLIGDWAPANPLHVSGSYFTNCGQTATYSTTFQAPTQPGEYRVRWITCYAFAAIRNFCGEASQGTANDPGVCPYVEVPFVVAANPGCAPSGNTLLANPTTFSGSNEVTIPSSGALNFGTNTFEVYVEFKITTGMVPGNRTLVMKGETVLGTGWFIGYGEWREGAQPLTYGIIAQVSSESSGGSNHDLRFAAPQIYDGQWHSAKLAREAGHAVLYLDCVEVDRVPLENLGSVSNNSPVRIGRHNQPKGYHIGEIRKVIVRSPK